MPDTLAVALEYLAPQRLTTVEPGVKIVLVDVDRQSLIRTLTCFPAFETAGFVAGYHLTAESAPPEPLYLDARPPVPHISLEQALSEPGVVLVVGMRMPYDVVAAIHKRMRKYLIVPSPDCYAPFVFEHIPDFYHTRKKALEEVYGLLCDTESKTAFARAVKARVTGESAYIVPEGEMYGHPSTDAQPGDTVMDGGIFRFDDELREFSLAVGSGGRVYSFEPELNNYQRILTAMEHHPLQNITLCNAGLFSEKTTLNITRSESSSRLVTEQGGGVSQCQVVALDGFTAENAISRVDLIKLDIEGAEVAALSGAEKTIRTHRPKLKISAYHTADHIWQIPLLLHSFVPEYTFTFRTPAPHLVEYILFAHVADVPVQLFAKT